jgi:hypothetical protein
MALDEVVSAPSPGGDARTDPLWSVSSGGGFD